MDWMLEQVLDDPQTDREVRVILERWSTHAHIDYTHPDADIYWERDEPCLS